MFAEELRPGCGHVLACEIVLDAPDLPAGTEDQGDTLVIFPWLYFENAPLASGGVAIGLFDEHTANGLTRFMFYVAIPAMLFRSMASADLPETVPWRYLTAFYVPSFLLFGIGMLLAKVALHWDRPRRVSLFGAYPSEGAAGTGAVDW